MSDEQRKPENPSSQEEGTYSAVEEELQRTEKMLQVLFRDAYYQYHADELIPGNPPDFSFMEEPPSESPEPEKPEVSRRHHPGRILRIAASLFLCFLLGGGMFCLSDTSVAHAARFHLEKFMYQISGHYYSSDENTKEWGDSISILVDSMEDIDRAVRFMPELYVPSFIPEGWKLERLELRKTIKGLKTAKYTFVDQASRTFTIDEELLLDSIITSNYMESDPIELEHRKVMVLQDDCTGLYCVNYIENNVFVTISGDLQEEELLHVADKLTQSGGLSKNR